MLCVEKRLVELEGYGQRKRSYQKKDGKFWFEGGKEEAARQVKRISCSSTDNQVILHTRQGLMKKSFEELQEIASDSHLNVSAKKPRKQELVDLILNNQIESVNVDS